MNEKTSDSDGSVHVCDESGRPRLVAINAELVAACLAMLATWGGDDEDEIIAARDRARAAVVKATGVAP